MFTGIIEATSPILDTKVEDEITTLTLQTPREWRLRLGQSIATDGVCLTVTKLSDVTYETELMPETLSRSSFGANIPKRVNLERAMIAGDRLEGHMVQGHVDSTGSIVAIDESPQWRTLKISYPKDKRHLLVEKGSIALDGTSLTLVEVSDEWFSVSLIPHTLEHTTIGDKTIGSTINIEFDILGKYIEQLIKGKH